MKNIKLKLTNSHKLIRFINYDIKNRNTVLYICKK